MHQHAAGARCGDCNDTLEWLGEYYHCANCGRVVAQGSD